MSRSRATARIDVLEARRLLTDIFVSISGTNANGGTIDSPVRTIQHAADLAQPGDTVFIRGGTYRETVTPPRSGTAAARITFCPYNNESVTVSGTDALGAWTQAPGTEVFFTTMNWNYTSDFQSNQVFAGGEMLNLARWPTEVRNDLVVNPYEATIDSVMQNPANTAQLLITDAEFTEPAARWVGAKIWVNLSRAGADGQGQTGTVVAVSGNQITVSGIDTRLGNQPWGVGTGTQYYLFDAPSTALNNSGGIPAAIDRGEWYRDASQNRLFIRMRDGSAPQNIEAKRRSYAFNLDSRSYITVKDLNLFGTSVTTDLLASGRNVSPGGIAPASNLVFSGLNAKYVTHFNDNSGNYQNQWQQKTGLILSGSDITLQDSTVRFSAGSLLSSLGTRARIFNNTFADGNYTVSNAGAVNFGKTNDPGPGFAVSTDVDFGYNTVYNTPGLGVAINTIKSTTNNVNDIRARVHHNVIHDVMLRSFDSGAIDTVATDGQYTRIDHNVIYNISGQGNHGIYLDFGYKYVVDHNVVFDVNQPILLNWYNGWAGSTPTSQDVRVFNNTAIAAKATESGIGNAFDNQNPGVVLRNNLVSKASNVGGSWTISNERLAAASLFIDAAVRDYRLASTAAAAIDQGVSVAPFDDPIVGTAPDVGAYEFGAAVWSAGSNLPPAGDVAPTELTAIRQTSGVIRLAWTDNATTERGYVVERTKDFNAWSVIAMPPSNTDQYDDTVPSAGTWVYRVRTRDSAPSRVASVNVPRSAYAIIQAESNDLASGVYNESGPPVRVAGFDAGDYLGYYGLDFGTGGANKIGLRLAVPDSGGNRRVEVRLDSLTGQLVGSFVPAGTGSWSTFVEQFGTITAVTGVHDVYIVGVSGNGIFNLDALRFLPLSPSAPLLLSSSDTGTSDTDRVTADATPTFTGDAAEGATVELLDGGVVVGSTMAVEGQWTITATTRPDGVHAFTVRATGGGVVGTTNSAATSVTIDGVGPSVASVNYLFDAASPTIEILFGEDVVTSANLLDVLALRNVTLDSAVPAAALSMTYDSAARRALITFSALPANGDYTLDLPTGAVSDVAGNVSTAASSSFFILAGDADRDRAVTFADLLIVAQNYGSTGRSFSAGNFDYDSTGTVDFGDLLILAQSYGQTLLSREIALTSSSAPTAIRKRREPLLA